MQVLLQASMWMPSFLPVLDAEVGEEGRLRIAKRPLLAFLCFGGRSAPKHVGLTADHPSKLGKQLGPSFSVSYVGSVFVQLLAHALEEFAPSHLS